jgi:ubiquinone/menaquinone biosynthesis C-methylase UbiE
MTPPKPPLDLADPELVSALDETSLWSAPFGLALLETVRLRPDLRALDVGFGAGFPLIELAERIGPHGQVWGLDPWRSALDRAQLKLRKYGLDNVELVLGAAEQMPFADESFDLLVSNNGLNNVQDQPKSFAECFRVCRPGAQFVATMNLPGSMREFYDEFAALLRETGRSALVAVMEAHIAAKRKSRAELEALIRAAGFELVSVREDSFRFRYADGSALFAHHFIRLAFLPSWREVLPEADPTEFFGRLEARLNRLAAQRGEIALTIPFVCFDCRKA